MTYTGSVNTRRPRMTLIGMHVLDVIMNAPPDDPAWGLRICEESGHGAGTVYPALERMLRFGWLEDSWEEPQPEDRPRRRYYRITDAGRAAYQQANAPQDARKAAWRLAQQPEGRA